MQSQYITFTLGVKEGLYLKIAKEVIEIANTTRKQVPPQPFNALIMPSAGFCHKDDRFWNDNKQTSYDMTE